VPGAVGLELNPFRKNAFLDSGVPGLRGHLAPAPETYVTLAEDGLAAVYPLLVLVLDCALFRRDGLKAAEHEADRAGK
jgi:hypothetical protein